MSAAARVPLWPGSTNSGCPAWRLTCVGAVTGNLGFAEEIPQLLRGESVVGKGYRVTIWGRTDGVGWRIRAVHVLEERCIMSKD